MRPNTQSLLAVMLLLIAGCASSEINRTATIGKCDYVIGFNHKEENLAYPGGCPRADEQAYLTGYRTSRKIQLVTMQINEGLAEISKLNSESRKQNDSHSDHKSGKNDNLNFDFDFTKEADRSSALLYSLTVLPLQLAVTAALDQDRSDRLKRQEADRTESIRKITNNIERLYTKKHYLLEFDSNMRQNPAQLESYLLAYHQKSGSDNIDIDRPLAPYLESLKVEENNSSIQKEFHTEKAYNVSSLVYSEVPHLKYNYQPALAAGLLGFGIGHALIGKESYYRSGWIYTVLDAALVGLLVNSNRGIGIGGLMISHLTQLYSTTVQNDYSYRHNSEILTQNNFEIPFYIAKF